jgi:Ca2+-binding EF-hand superfamily protein
MHFVALSLGALVVASGVAFAQNAPPSADPRAAHAVTDTDHDGKIDREEFHHRMVEIFFFSDSDRDGYVVLTELRTFDAPTLFERADRDHDGRLQMSEFIDARFGDFKDSDTDSDGELSVEEIVERFERDH